MKVQVKIKMEVTSWIELGETETLEQFQLRCGDIYLHGEGQDGYLEKEDLGGDISIEILEAGL